MRTAIVCILLAMIAILADTHRSQAQEISGFSSVGAVSVCTGLGCTRKTGFRTYNVEEQAYVDTEEDYTASLYYDVTSTSAMYYGGNSVPVDTGTVTGNPTASGSYSITYSVVPGTNDSCVTVPGIAPYGPTTYCDDISPGVYTETTDHIVDMFYVAALGEYYDLYGFTNGDGDGDYNSGYWFSVTVWGLYVAEASALVGQSYDSSNNTGNTNFQGPSIETALYQTFIPDDWVQGPGLPQCSPDIFAGDNRGFSPQLESYRAMQAISMGIGGFTGVDETNAPPAQATGTTFEFSLAVLVNNVIPDTAYNFDYLGECTIDAVDEWGQASTDEMQPPQVTYTGPTTTGTVFSGQAENPVPLFAFPIGWFIPLTLQETDPSDLMVTGTLGAKCYPASEVSVGGTDVGDWMPPSSSLTYVTACLGGLGAISQPISTDIPLVVAP